MSVVPDLVPWLWDVIVKSRVLELVIYMLGCLVVVFFVVVVFRDVLCFAM